MKTITKTFATGIVASVLLFASCKKGETGPAGENGMNGANGVVTTSTDGFIKGTISGTRQNGTSFSETFEYKNYFGGESGRLDSNTVASYAFSIMRGESDILDRDVADIMIATTTKTATTGNMTINQFMFTKSMGTNKQFEFMINSGANASVTGLSYNTGSGLFTGNFNATITGLQNSTGNSATITGSFEATITQIYNLVHSGTSVKALNNNTGFKK